MLDVLGLRPADASCYEALVSLGASSPAELAGIVDLHVEVARGCLLHLVRLGLAMGPDRDTGRFAAAPPMVALGALLVEREGELRDAQQQMNALNELYQSSAHDRTITEIIDIVQGPEAVHQRFVQLQRGARELLRYFVLSDVVVLPFRGNAPERQAALKRGIQIQVVAGTSALDDPQLLEVAHANRELGYELRIVPRLPTRMVIVDEELALLPLSPRPHVEAPGAVLVQVSGLLTMLIALFELTWRGAAPATLGTDLTASVRDTELEPVDYDLLRLLDLGVTDRVVAQQLHLSVRTGQRRVALLMEVAMASNRFQLGRAAHARGWLSPPADRRTTPSTDPR